MAPNRHSTQRHTSSRIAVGEVPKEPVTTPQTGHTEQLRVTCCLISEACSLRYERSNPVFPVQRRQEGWPPHFLDTISGVVSSRMGFELRLLVAP